MSRSTKRPYRGSRAVDKSCRSHGSCPHCEGKRKHKVERQAPAVMDLKPCYQCLKDVAYLFEDSRCKDCTRIGART